MKEVFIEKNFKPDSLRLIADAEEICQRYAAQGYDLSLRQLYYQFVAADKLANTEENYKRLGGIISDARLAGMIDWEMIKDRGRETLANSHWSTPADILDSAAYSFRVDTWADQPNHVEVMVEKQALEGVLHPVCRNLDIAFTANKGYSSSSALYEIGKRLRKAFIGRGDDANQIALFNDLAQSFVMDKSGYGGICNAGDAKLLSELFSDREPTIEEYDAIESANILIDDYREAYYDGKSNSQKLACDVQEAVTKIARAFLRPCVGGKELHVIYLGDHDPSGIDMTRDVRERLELFSGSPVNVHRVALNMDQIEEYGPPENPAKMTDSRAGDYVRRFGTSSWELDALEPSLLARIVTGMVEDLRDPDLYEAARAKQEQWKRELQEAADKYRASVT